LYLRSIRTHGDYGYGEQDKNYGRQRKIPAMVGAFKKLNKRYIWLQNLQKEKQNVVAVSKKVDGTEYRQTNVINVNIIQLVCD
jgi:hypothetical protein